MRTPKCPVCEGRKTVTFLANQEAHYDGLEDADIRTETCEDCGGTGKDVTFMPLPHPHHTNPKAKEVWT